MEALAKAGANVLGAFLNRSRDRAQADYMDYAAEPDAARADKVATPQGQSGVGA